MCGWAQELGFYEFGGAGRAAKGNHIDMGQTSQSSKLNLP
jgi:hypothetical protein